MRIKILVSVLATLLVGNAQAHQIWIEPEGKKLNLHFGEYDENLKEAAPGLLDKMPTPDVRSVTAGAESPIKASKGKDGFSLDGTTTDTSVVAEVRNYPAFERKQGEQVLKSKWVVSTRYIGNSNVIAPKSILDIVPNGAPGKFKLYFRGQPLAKAKASLIAPNGWQKEAHSNAQGEFEVAPLWKGLYVIEVQHKDAGAGEVDGEKYDSASFTSTVSFINANGPETERPPAAKPNQPK